MDIDKYLIEKSIIEFDTAITEQFIRLLNETMNKIIPEQGVITEIGDYLGIIKSLSFTSLSGIFYALFNTIYDNLKLDRTISRRDFIFRCSSQFVEHINNIFQEGIYEPNNERFHNGERTH